MDPADDLSDPITLITDPAKSAHNPNNPGSPPASRSWGSSSTTT